MVMAKIYPDFTREPTKEELAALDAIVPLPPIEGQEEWEDNTPESERDNFLLNLKAQRFDDDTTSKKKHKE